MEEQLIFWKTGEIIYNFNDNSDFAYLLKVGEVEVQSQNGTKVGFINKNEIFGEQSILLGTRRTTRTIAARNSNAIIIPRDTLISQYEKSPIIIKAILRTTYIRLTNLNSTKKKSLKSFI